MSDFMKMDIFFVVATLGIALGVACGIILCYLLWRILKVTEVIIKDVSHIVADAKQVSSTVKEEVHTAKSKFVGAVSAIIGLIGMARKGSRKSNSKRARGEHATEE